MNLLGKEKYMIRIHLINERKLESSTTYNELQKQMNDNNVNAVLIDRKEYIGSEIKPIKTVIIKEQIIMVDVIE
jgi:hypothetical protein